MCCLCDAAGAVSNVDRVGYISIVCTKRES